jgi:hypothetical protein
VLPGLMLTAVAGTEIHLLPVLLTLNLLSSGIASPNYESTFSYRIEPTRAADSSRVMQRQTYPAFRRPTTQSFMRLAYDVPLVTAAFEAYTGLVVRLASAVSVPWPIAVADMDIPAFPPGLTSHALLLALRIKFAATSGHECSRVGLFLRSVTERMTTGKGPDFSLAPCLC